MALGAAGQMVAGQEANANNRRIIEARNAATQAELDRQHAYQGQSGGIFDQTLGAFTPAVQGQRLNTNQGAATQFFNTNAPGSAALGGFTFGDANPYAKASQNATVADAVANNVTRTNALGTLSGWDQLMFNNGVGLADSGRRLGTISGLARNSANVGDLEREVAGNNAWRPPSGLSDLLGFAGNTLAYKGGSSTTLPLFSMFGK